MVMERQQECVNADFIPKSTGIQEHTERIPDMDGVARLFLLSAIFTEYDLFEF